LHYFGRMKSERNLPQALPSLNCLPGQICHLFCLLCSKPAYLTHPSLHTGDIVERQIAGRSVDVVDVQSRQVHQVQHQRGIVAHSTRVGHVDGELMREVAILDQSLVGLIRDQGVRVEVVDGAFVVVVGVTPRIPDLE